MFRSIFMINFSLVIQILCQFQFALMQSLNFAHDMTVLLSSHVQNVTLYDTQEWIYNEKKFPSNLNNDRKNIIGMGSWHQTAICSRKPIKMHIQVLYHLSHNFFFEQYQYSKCHIPLYRFNSYKGPLGVITFYLNTYVYDSKINNMISTLSSQHGLRCHAAIMTLMLRTVKSLI